MNAPKLMCADFSTCNLQRAEGGGALHRTDATEVRKEKPSKTLLPAAGNSFHENA
jgi:hypothetical protein